MAERCTQTFNLLDDNKDSTFDIIIVLDSELSKNTRIRDQTQDLRELIRAEKAKARTYEFKPVWTRPGYNIWQAIVRAGTDLGVALEEKQRNEELVRPLLFISFGFGGLVTKRAFGHIKERKENDHASTKLYRAQKDCVFIGVPNPTQSHTDKWERLNTHLLAYGRFGAHHLRACTTDREKIVGLSKDFTEIIKQDTIVESIFSIHEEKKTKYRYKLKTKTALIVGKDFSCMNARDETVACSTNYFEMAVFEKPSSVYDTLVKAIKHCGRKIGQAMTLGNRGETRFVAAPNEDNQPYRFGSTITPGVQDTTTEQLSAVTLVASQEPGVAAEVAAVVDPSQPSDAFEVVFAGPRCAQLPCYYLDQVQRNQNFVERREILSQIDRVLLADNNDISSFALCGKGGIGKTQLVTDYALSRRDEFDAILWVLADTPIKIANSFDGIAKALRLAEQYENGDVAASRDLVLEWLKRPRKMPTQPDAGAASRHAEQMPGSHRRRDGGDERANWLLILDNVQDLDLVYRYWPSSSRGKHRSCILVTSRDALARTDLATDGIDLPPMSTEECARLLEGQVPAEAVTAQSRPAATDLAELVDCLPLAMTAMAARMRKTHMAIEEFWRRYRGAMADELRRVQSWPPREQYPHTLNTVWDLTQFSAKARGLLHAMVFLDGDAMSDLVLEQHMSAVDYPLPGDEYVEARTEILQTSLVHYNGGGRFLSWHQFVQDVVGGQVGDDERADDFVLVVQLLDGAWTFHQDRFTAENLGDARRDDVLPHVIRIPEKYEKFARSQAMSVSTRRMLVNLVQSAGLYLAQTCQFAPAKLLLELAMQICQDHEDSMQDLLADTYFSYTRYGVATNMNPNTIMEYCQKFHDICQSRNDGSESAIGDVATSHTVMGQGFLLLDSPVEAITHCQECIAIEEKLPDHVAEGVISQFALIYEAWGHIGRGDYDRAADKAQCVIDYRARKFGPDDNMSDKLGLALQCLGRARELQGRIHECVRAYHRAMDNFHNIKVADNFRYAQMSLKLGEHYSRQAGHAQYAPKFIRDAIRIFGMYDYYKPELARALFKMHQYETTCRSRTDDRWLVRARKAYCELRPGESDDPGEAEFDKLVRFWSR